MARGNFFDSRRHVVDCCQIFLRVQIAICLVWRCIQISNLDISMAFGLIATWSGIFVTIWTSTPHITIFPFAWF